MWRVNPGSKLHGNIEISGAKNSMQFLTTASLLSPYPLKLKRIPLINDTYTIIHILEDLNYSIHLDKTNATIEIIPRDRPSNWMLPFDEARKLRSCLLFIPGLLRHFGKAFIPFPGGDAIGDRPLNTHFYVLEKFGCEIKRDDKGYYVSAKKIVPSNLILPYPSFTGTGLAMMLAATLNGTTTIKNAGKEPELKDLAKLMNLMGIETEGAGTDSIIIHGNPSPSGAEMDIMYDRLEAGTFLMAAAITQGDLIISSTAIQHLEILVNKLTNAGCKFIENDGKTHFYRHGILKPQEVTTGPFPAFPTDLQPQFLALMTQAIGHSQIHETMHTKRFLQVPYLVKMGAKIDIVDSRAMVDGPSDLSGGYVKAQDIRGGASLVIASLVVKHDTIISGIYHLERGFSDFFNKLRKVGVNLELL